MKKQTKHPGRRSQRDYSLAFKLQVVMQAEKGELTHKKAQKHYGIKGRSTVLVWLRKHGTNGVAATMQMAVRQERINAPLIHHSDRGLQYAQHNISNY